MSISDKTRKILWGRSGNRCSICKNELVIDATEQDDESIVAEECHIISPMPNGPRHDSSYPIEKLDSYDNLMLLCCTHHKMADDQSATFTTNILRQIKSNHELWKYFRKIVLYNKYYETFDEFKKACKSFFRRSKKHKEDISSLLTENFQIIGSST